MSPENAQNTENYEQMSFLDGANKVVIPVESITPDIEEIKLGSGNETVTQISPSVEDPKETIKPESEDSVSDKTQEKIKIEWYKDPKIFTVYRILKDQYTETSELWPLFKKAEHTNEEINYKDIKRITSKYCKVVYKRRGKNIYKWDDDRYKLPDPEEPTENHKRKPISGADAYAMWEERKENNQD